MKRGCDGVLAVASVRTGALLWPETLSRMRALRSRVTAADMQDVELRMRVEFETYLCDGVFLRFLLFRVALLGVAVVERPGHGRGFKESSFFYQARVARTA